LISCKPSETGPFIGDCSSQPGWIAADCYLARNRRKCREWKLRENQAPILEIFAFKQFQALLSDRRLIISRQEGELLFDVLSDQEMQTTMPIAVAARFSKFRG
jgi:hypothetical protein